MKVAFNNRGGHKKAEYLDSDVQEMKIQVLEEMIKDYGVFSLIDCFEIKIFS